MKICLIVGHSKLKNGSYTSADGTKNGGCNEYRYCKNFAKDLKKYLTKYGSVVNVIRCPENVFLSKNEEKKYKQNKLRGKKYDLIIELHLNSSPNLLATGSECFYHSTKGRLYGENMLKALGKVYKNRGAKYSNTLYALKLSKYPTVLLELFFCSNKNDYKKARGSIKRGSLAKKLAKQIINYGKVG